MGGLQRINRGELGGGLTSRSKAFQTHRGVRRENIFENPGQKVLGKVKNELESRQNKNTRAKNGIVETTARFSPITL